MTDTDRKTGRPRLVVVADDLTGAADTAASFGPLAHVVVALDPTAELPDADVVAIDTDSRHQSEELAAQAVRSAVRTAKAAGRPLYKKIDSTLRGNVAVEVATAARELSATALVCPTFPETGRTVIGGQLHVHGAPGENGDLLALFTATGVSTAVLPLATVRQGTPVVVAALTALRDDGVEVICADAVTDDDLRVLATAAGVLRPHLLPTGSAGLARVVASAYLREPKPLATHPGPVLTVLGSYAPVAREQRTTLAASGDVTEVTVKAPFGAAELEPAIAELAAVTGDALLVPDPAAPVDRARATEVAAALATVAKKYIEPRRESLGGLILTGGETARAVLLSLGVTEFTVLGEIEPGVVRSSVPILGGLPLVTKAGAFGEPATLDRARRGLHPSPSLKAGGSSMARPIVAITMGDAAGVGPEVVVKAMAEERLYQWCRPLVVGDAGRLRKAIEITGVPLTVRTVEGPEAAGYAPGVVDCVDLGLIPENLPFGQLSAVAGEGAFQFIRVATELAVAGRVQAICTAPLNKEALHAAGHVYPGHTELLAELTGTAEVSMMLSAPKLKVVHVTTHIGLLDAVEKIEPGLVARTIRRGDETLRRSGIARPRIAVCGINPHAGENGLFGRGEEEVKVVPAIRTVRAEGIDVHGPLPADTVFFRAMRGDFDLVVAMYHDQGHAPVKVLGLETGVNITIGLPVIRTSVDHGTAFDIAGTGKADHASMLEALRQAVELAPASGEDHLG